MIETSNTMNDLDSFIHMVYFFIISGIAILFVIWIILYFARGFADKKWRLFE